MAKVNKEQPGVTPSCCSSWEIVVCIVVTVAPSVDLFAVCDLEWVECWGQPGHHVALDQFLKTLQSQGMIV